MLAHNHDHAHEDHAHERTHTNLAPRRHAHGSSHAHDSGHGHAHDSGHGHAHDSGHGHAHDSGHGRERGLRLALALTLVILLVEALGSLLSHSLALLADAGHVLTDLGALGMALFAAHQAHRPAGHTRTYGYHRTGILVALLNAGALIAVVIVIAVEAYGRLAHPQPVQAAPMIVAAGVGFLANLFVATRLHGHSAHDLNVRGAWLHVMGDAGAAAGVIVAAAFIALTGWTAIDPILSVAISVLIAIGAWRLLNEALAVLMEAPPREIDMAELVQHMRRVQGVCDVHDLHVWSIGSGLTMLSCHVRIDDQPLAAGLQVVERLNHLLAERFGIAHCTIQPETAGCTTTGLYCALPCGCCDQRSAVSTRPSDPGNV